MDGRIDIHCHLLPGIDDGCVNYEESLATIGRLIELGYTASVLTPHIWPHTFPGVTPETIAHWAGLLRERVAEAGLKYTLLAGGELQLFPDAVGWMKANGVPSMGESNAVLMDSWDDGFPKHAFKTVDWLLSEGYQPVLAHPERMGGGKTLAKTLDTLKKQGVLFQGNFRPFHGSDGAGARELAYAFLEEGRYDVMALDLHRPDTLDDRLGGLALVESHLGKARLDQLIGDAPRALLSKRLSPAG